MPDQFWLLFAAGFVGQIVDGSIGMAFGVISTSVMLSFGITPLAASAIVHTAEIFTTGASGTSHLYYRNVDWRLVRRLAPAGVIGGALGAAMLSIVDGEAMVPWVSLYLTLIGGYITFKAFRPTWPRDVTDRAVPPIGLIGGFLDAAGGGGWGPMVSSSLIGRGHVPRTAIGSVNLSEFFVTTVISAVFMVSLGVAQITSALGLIAGGIVAAPLGGWLVSRVPTRPMMFVVGVSVIATSVPRVVALSE